MGAGAIPPDDTQAQLKVTMTPEGMVQLSWGDSCVGTDEDFAVYMGDLGDFTTIEPETCSTGGLQSYSYPPDPVNVFYLVVPVDTQSATQGSYGTDSNGVARTPGVDPCYAQVVESTCQ